MYKVVDNKKVNLTPLEEALIRDEWAKEDEKTASTHKKIETYKKRIAAIEALLEKLMAQNADIPEVANYLNKK